MKVAIIGAGHWHVSVYYVPALKKLDVDMVATLRVMNAALRSAQTGQPVRMDSEDEDN